MPIPSTTPITMPAKTSRKKKKRKIRRLRKNRLYTLAACLLLIPFSLWGLQVYGQSRISALEAGRTYLQELSSLDQQAISTKLSDLAHQQRMETMETGPVSLFSCFNNALILGDSRSEGFVSHGLMSPSINLSVLSTDITHIPNQLPQIQAAKPELLYFCYGTNDVYRGIGNSADQEFGEGYAALLEQYVDMCLEVSPKSQVVINGLLPCSKILTPVGYESYCEVIDLYNKHLKELCRKRKWIFIDNDPLFKEWGEKCFVSDGIHFVEEFFEPWAINMITSVYPELAEAKWY